MCGAQRGGTRRREGESGPWLTRIASHLVAHAVTTLRSASQIQPHLRNLAAASSSSLAAAASTTSNPSALPLPPRTPTPKVAPTQIILIPLSDSPTLPSLSLLLAQGTTPSAVCFQQDLLDRARRTEEDWLPSALDMIALASQAPSSTTVATGPPLGIGGHALQAPPLPPLVVAYSANPALSESVVIRCIQAGAIDVLQPPYEVEDTVERIKRMVKIYLSGGADARRDDHAYDAGGPSRSRKMSVASSLEQVQEDPDQYQTDDAAGRTIGSTAIGHTGGSSTAPHRGQGSQVQRPTPPPFTRYSSAPLHTASGQTDAEADRDDPAGPTDPLIGTGGLPAATLDGQAQSPTGLGGSPATMNSAQSGSHAGQGPMPAHSPYLIRHHLQTYNFDARRRSVDTGGLALALERAAKRFQVADAVPTAAGSANEAAYLRRASHWEQTGINVPSAALQRVPGEQTSPEKTMSVASSPGPHGGSSFRQSRPAQGRDANGSSPAKRAKRIGAEAGEENDRGEDSDGRETALAELLGEMFRQTRLAVEITMVDYPA